MFLGVGTGFLGLADGGWPSVRECCAFIAGVDDKFRRLSSSGSVLLAAIPPPNKYDLRTRLSKEEESS